MLVSGFSRITQTARIAACAVLGISLIIGTSIAEAKPLDPISEGELYDRLAKLQHMPWSGKSLERPSGWFSGCRKSTVTLTVGDPLTMEYRDLDVVLIRPDSNKPVPVSMVLPTMDGVTAVERAIASNLCAMNVAAIIADVNQNTVPEEIPSWGFEDQNNRRAILSLRTIIDYIEGTPYFDSRKIGMIGSSLGGVTTSFMAGIEPQRISAFVIVVGGGNIPYTLSVSDNEKILELRRRRMAAEGLTDPEHYEDKLREILKFDPMYFASFAVRDKIFMALSRSDTKVPTLVQEDLFRAFGEPEHTVFNVGHVSTVIGMAFFYFDYVSDFLSKRFGIPALRKRIQQPVDELATLSLPMPQFQY